MQDMTLGVRLAGWTQLFHDSSAGVILLWYLPALVLLLPGTLRGRIAPGLAAPPARFFWRFGALATLLTVGATVSTAYEADDSFRYFYTLAWWPMILIAAMIATALSRHRLSAVGSITVALLIVVSRLPEHRPALLSWTTPVADCLLAHRQSEALTGGLAGYWQARSIEASLDWALPVEQIDPDGRFKLWGNNPERARANARRYNFIVMQDLDPLLIRARYGTPLSVLQCPGSALWIYARGGLEKAFLN